MEKKVSLNIGDNIGCLGLFFIVMLPFILWGVAQIIVVMKG